MARATHSLRYGIDASVAPHPRARARSRPTRFSCSPFRSAIVQRSSPCHLATTDFSRRATERPTILTYHFEVLARSDQPSGSREMVTCQPNRRLLRRSLDCACHLLVYLVGQLLRALAFVFTHHLQFPTSSCLGCLRSAVWSSGKASSFKLLNRTDTSSGCKVKDADRYPGRQQHSQSMWGPHSGDP